MKPIGAAFHQSQLKSQTCSPPGGLFESHLCAMEEERKQDHAADIHCYDDSYPKLLQHPRF
jgi:hypothetical protein